MDFTSRDFHCHFSGYNARVRRTWAKLGRGKLLYTACAVAAVLHGCMPAVSDIRLLQPHMDRWQRDLQLRTEQTFWSPDKQSERILAEFPLPGATTGNPMYLLYLRVTAGEPSQELGGTPSAPAKGFFIQIRGDHAGLALITSGKIQVEKSSLSSEAVRRLRIDLNCEDGTHLTGWLIALRDDWQLTYFEKQRRPADVKILTGVSPAASSSIQAPSAESQPNP